MSRCRASVILCKRTVKMSSSSILKSPGGSRGLKRELKRKLKRELKRELKRTEEA